MALQTSCSEFLQTSFFDELLSQNVFISDDQLAFAKLSHQGPGGLFPNKFLNKSPKCQPVKKYNCTWCSYTTMRKDNLNVHIRRHTGERPYACPCCTRSFSDKSNYNVHVRKHAAEGLIPLGDSNSISALVPVTSSFGGLPIHEELFIPAAPKHKNSKQD